MSYWSKWRRIRANVERDLAHIYNDDNISSDDEPVAMPSMVDIENTAVVANEWCPEPELAYDTEDGADTMLNVGVEDGTRVEDDVECMEHIVESDTDTDTDDNDDDDSIANRLRAWVAKYSVSQICLSELLLILRPHFELPKDPRTLMKTHNSVDVMSDVKQLSKGSYYHFGVQNGVKHQMQNCTDLKACDVISVDINIDGVPLFKSTNGQFWPILGKLNFPGMNEPFVIGIFYGENKPSNLDFLDEFVTECMELQHSGITVNEFLYKFCIRAVVCDAPARSFVKCIKGHTSYSSCERCTVSGVWEGKMTFPDLNAPRRTDVAFDELQDAEHHCGKSPLSDLHIGMVSQFVLDYMHLICLGVVRRLIWLWTSGPVRVNIRLPARLVSDISSRLLAVRRYIPSEFARKPRSLSSWQRWKATEFRQFLLYTGPVVLVGKLSDAAYQNFMLLSVGMFLLLDVNVTPEYIDYAEQLLILFVRQFSDIYGSNMLVYNVHNVIHLADDVRKFGALDNVSAFAFENFLGKMVKLIRKPSMPLQQVVRRLMEQIEFSTPASTLRKPLDIRPCEEHNEGCVPEGIGVCRQYKRIFFDRLCISVHSGSNCILLGGDIALIDNILVKNKDIVIVYTTFSVVKDFFTYPLPSSHLRIYHVSHISSSLHMRPLSDFQKKAVMLPHEDGYVVIPLLHVQ